MSILLSGPSVHRGVSLIYLFANAAGESLDAEVARKLAEQPLTCGICFTSTCRHMMPAMSSVALDVM